MSFGTDVLAERKRRKLSRVKFAELVGLSPGQLNSVEREFREAKSDEIAVLTPFLSGGSPAVVPPAADGESSPPSILQPAPADVVALTEDEVEEDDQLQMFDDVLHVVIQSEPETTPVSTPASEMDGTASSEPELKSAPESVSVPAVITPLADDGSRRMTHGEFATFKRCRRKWWLGYYRQLGLPQENVTGAAPLGTRIHKALAAYYDLAKPFDQSNAWEVLEKTITDDTAALEELGWVDKIEELQKEAELARLMLEGYFEWVETTGADEGFTIIGAEQPIEVESGVEGVRLLGKLDLRVHRESDGARLFLDHKTVGNFTQPSQWLHMREQPIHYMLLEFLDLRASGQDAERSIGAIWNMIRKVKRTATAKPPFYQRVEVGHNIETLRSYWQHIVSGLTAMDQVRTQLDSGMDHHAVAYPTPTGDCVWDCDFFHICTMFDDGSRVEDFVETNLVMINPLKRYEPEGT